jgi:glycosyltransferase involved in cell wall biosynthesis
MQILFLSRWFPYPVDNGSKIRIYNLLRGLAKIHDISLISFSDHPNVDRENREMMEICRDVSVVQWKEFQPSSLRSLLGFFSPLPRSLIDTYSQQMEDTIKKKISTSNFDLVIISESQMYVYHPIMAGLTTLFEEVEVGVLINKSEQAHHFLTRMRNWISWKKHQSFLAKTLTANRVCTVVSEAEKNHLAEFLPRTVDIHVIPNGIMYRDYQGLLSTPEPNTMIFTGSFRYRPNYDAMVWFLKEVYPLIRLQIPDIQLKITGDTNGMPLPDSPGVITTGHVPDVKPHIASASLSLAPLLEGGGSRLKILEAMAIGTPVIATSKGAEGLAVEHGKHLLIADTPKNFSDSVISTLRDENLSNHLAHNAKILVEQTYDWSVIMPTFLSVVQKSVSPDS